MTYAAPTIGVPGLTVPTYADILQYLIDAKKTIHGSDIYLENDSTDYQELSVFALMLYDISMLLQYVYNNRGPLTAVGSGLDQIVKLNGIERKQASYSTCIVGLTGTIGATVVNGIVQDQAGYQWGLPSTVTLESTGSPAYGYKEVTAICATLGAVSATAGTIVRIVTAQAGWTSVTNPSAAVEGAPVETDAELRSRQSASVTRPSMNLVSGTWAALSAVDNVSRLTVKENPTGTPDADGLPPHSISCVVEGGTDEDVATAIWANRGIGCQMNPVATSPEPSYAVHHDVEDSVTLIVTTINFYRPDYVPIYVEIGVKQIYGYTSVTTDAVKSAVASYLNSLSIGEDLTISALYSVALSVTPDLAKPMFSITSLVAGISPGGMGSTDIELDYYQTTSGDIADITINVT